MNPLIALAAAAWRRDSAGDVTPPSVPTGLTASAVTATTLTLSWAASVDDSGVVAEYEVFQDGVSIGTTAGLSLAVSGLAPQITYQFAVRARDAAFNWSSQSAILSTTTAADTTAPSVPTGLASSAVGVQSFTLSWAASTDNVGVTGYEVFRDGVSIGTPSGTSLAVSGLAPNTAYSMTVRARDGAGNWSVQSAALSVTTAADTTAPSVPTGLASSAVTATSFTLSWAASTDNVGVTGYEVFRDGFSLGTAAGTSRSITGLSGSTTYSMKVRARDAAGNWSALSAAKSVTTNSGADVIAPSVPTGLASSAVTATSFTLSWAASTDNVGVTGYEVFRDGVSIGTPSGTSLAVSGLAPSTTYAMTVRARDAAGNWSAQSAAANATTAADTTAPSVPTGLSTSAVTATSFTLSWAASTDNVGVTGYEVFRNGVSIGTPSGTSLAVTGLAPSTTYAMTVRSRDAAGNWSAQSAASNTTTAADTTAPSVPTGLTASAITATSFTLSWAASTDNVGVTGYEVFRNGVSIGTPSGTSLAVTGLAPSTTYAMTVRSRDAAGNWSAQSAASNTTTAADTTAPSVPTGLAASSVTGTSFTLSWTASTDNFGVTGYEVFRDGVSIGTPSGTSFAVTGLTQGVTYSMTVRARDAAANWSAQSAALLVTTTIHSVSAPNINDGSSGTSTATVAGGVGPFTHSWVLVSGSGIALSNTTSATVTASRTSGLGGQFTATARDDVTDTGNGNVVRSTTISITLENPV